jgi:two-component system sensor kinase FixL
MTRTPTSTGSAPGKKSARRSTARRLLCEQTEVDVESRRLVQELQVHQIELETQNGELRRTQRVLEASLARYTELCDNAPTGYLTLDAHGRIVYANRAASNLLKVASADLRTLKLSSFVARSSGAELTQALQRAQHECTTVQIEVPLQSVGVDSLLSVRLIISPDTEALTARVVLVDVTGARADAVRTEQCRLRAELHDGVGQELTGLGLLLSTLQARAQAMEGAPLRKEFEELRSIVKHAIKTCRTLSHGLSSVSEDEGGLVPALGHLAERARIAGGPNVSLRVTGHRPVRLPSATADHLYRIAQEALNNALKHSRAQAVVISVDVRRDAVKLEIVDDGVGFELDQPGGVRGMGLHVMRDRAFAIHARLSVQPAKSGGTCICCVCPQRSDRGEPEDGSGTPILKVAEATHNRRAMLSLRKSDTHCVGNGRG